ncbi:MAG: hypothetical protein JWM28_3979 [Chitinophagaceae bacterium]|nr:hypothetical protein [Chitinophagaceae bacterium]
MGDVKYNRIKIILVEFNLSQLEFAAILKVDKNTVTRWCKNHNQPSLIQLREIAEFFRIDVRQLVEPTEWSGQRGPSGFDLFKEQRRKQKEMLAFKKKADAKKAKRKK